MKEGILNRKAVLYKGLAGGILWILLMDLFYFLGHVFSEDFVLWGIPAEMILFGVLYQSVDRKNTLFTVLSGMGAALVTGCLYWILLLSGCPALSDFLCRLIDLDFEPSPGDGILFLFYLGFYVLCSLFIPITAFLLTEVRLQIQKWKEKSR